MSRFGVDPGFKHMIPAAYDPVGIDWRSYFEPEFQARFNGLMIRGAAQVGTVFCAVFPSEDVLDRFFAAAQPGDLFLSHHALDMRMGDPRRKTKTAPFLPIAEEQLRSFREKGLSYYSSHIPMDLNPTVGTVAALIELLDARVVDRFLTDEYGSYGAICEIEPISSDALAERLRHAHEIPYVESFGPKYQEITRIAAITGCTRVASYREAERKGAQAYLAGEIRNHIDNDIGRSRDAEVMEYAQTTAMSFIGTSHAASEFLVMKMQMKPWLERNAGVDVQLLREEHWWR
jgi:putative NIF3 family GTP cyclohydrolase 1 type 2